MWAAIIQLVLFTFYTAFIWRVYGVQKSLSETWYVIKHKWLFSVILCFSIGVLQLTHGTVMFFLSGALLCFVGSASNFRKEKMTKIVHYVGAVGAISISLAQLGLLGIWWPLELCIVLGFPILLLENRMWWMEIVAFYAILGGIIQLKL